MRLAAILSFSGVLDHLATLHKPPAPLDGLLRAARALSVYQLMTTYPLAERNARRTRLHEGLLYNCRPLAQARRAELFAEILTLYGVMCDRDSNGEEGEPAAVWALRAHEAVTARQRAHREALRARQALSPTAIIRTLPERPHTHGASMNLTDGVCET
jgi:hypothetical protein